MTIADDPMNDADDKRTIHDVSRRLCGFTKAIFRAPKITHKIDRNGKMQRPFPIERRHKVKKRDLVKQRLIAAATGKTDLNCSFDASVKMVFALS